MQNEPKLHLISHPVLQHKLGFLRDKKTPALEFRRVMHEVSCLLAYEASRGLEMRSLIVETPIGDATILRVKKFPILVSIMRAGNEMLDGVLSILPEARVGHIGIYRDRFGNNTIEYYFKLPKQVKDEPIFLLDPLLATGDTILASIDRLKQFFVGAITVLCVLVSPQGVEKIQYFHPEVTIYAVAQEAILDEKGFLIPGIGDVGNRLYNVA